MTQPSLRSLEHHDAFIERHIGPNDAEIARMLRVVGHDSLEAMTDGGLEVQREHVRFSKWFTEDEGARVCAELLDAAGDLTAIVAANDLLALGCYDTLEERGLRCPEDISIVGFNDMPFVDRLRPPLTTVRVPQREIGTVAADLMLQRLSDETDGANAILLEPTLVVRGSTAPARAR
jgi:LacI family transcriptional regulator